MFRMNGMPRVHGCTGAANLLAKKFDKIKEFD